MRRSVLSGVVLILAVGIALAIWSSDDRAQVTAPAGSARFDRPLQFKALDASTPVRIMRGRVTGDSSPVAGAFVLVTSDEGGAFSSTGCPEKPEASFFECHCGSVSDALAWRFSEGEGEAIPIASAVSKPDGTFEVAGVPEGRFAVWAETTTGAAVTLGVDATATVELRIRPGRTFEGVTLKPDGSALANALVGAALRAHSRFFLAKTDSRGRYRLGPLPEGDYELMAAAEGFEPEARPARFGTKLELRATRRVSGTVTLGSKPVPGIDVRAKVFCSHATVATDSNGRFTIDRVRAEKTVVFARRGIHGGFREVDLRASDLSDVEITLDEGGSVRGSVQSETGDRIAGARASLELMEPDFEAEGITDSAGVFEVLGLPPGQYSMRLKPPAGSLEPGHRFVMVEKGRESSVSYVLGVAGTFTGKVVDEQARPIPGASISGHLAQGSALGADGDEHQGFEAKTGLDGAFTLAHAPAGRLELAVGAEGYLGAELSVDSPGTAEIRLLRGGELRVEVRTQKGSPAAEAHVTITTPEGDAGAQTTAHQLTDASGRASFDALKPGPYRVTAQLEWPKGSDAPHQVRTIATDVRVASNAPAETRLQFDEGLVLRGRVVDKKSGEGIERALVIATDEVTDPPGIRTDVITYEAGGGTYTDSTGRFTIEHLRANPHDVRWVAQGYQFPDRQLIRPGGPDVTLHLTKDPSVRGRVLRPDGTPVTQFSVDHTRFESKDGRFEQTFDDEGTTTFTIEAPGFATLLKTTKLTKGADADLGDLTMPTGRDVRVTVLAGTPPQPVPNIAVELGVRGSRRWTLDHDLAEASTNENGVAAFKAVPKIPLDVLVVKVDVGAAQLELSPGAAELTLSLEPTGTIEGVVRNQKGAPIRNVRVVASAWSPHKDTTTDAAGRFVLSGLPADNYAVRIEGINTNNFGLRSRDVELAAGATARVELVETKGSQLTVAIAERECRWLLLAEGAAGPVSLAELKRVMTNAAQAYSHPPIFQGLSAGTHSLICVQGDFDEPYRAGAIVRVELTGADMTISPKFDLVPLSVQPAPK